MKRRRKISKADRKLEAAFDWIPSEPITGPIRPSNQFGECCDTKLQRQLHLLADRMLRDCGFFKGRKEMIEWLSCPYNRAWFEAANPNAITQDGHLSSHSAFC